MRCAVIGAKGYIGKHIVFYLKQNGHYVESYDVIDCNEEGYVKCDLTCKDDISRMNLDVDYLFMFAGLTGTHVGFDKYDTFLDVNERGLLNLLDTIRHSTFRPKIIYPSTRLVYKGADHPLKENDDKETKTIYAVNKLASEGLLYAYNKSFDIPFTIFRICVPFGNMLSDDYSFGTVGFFIRQARDDKRITLYGDGSIKRTFTSMHDLCYQIVEGGFKPESDNQIFNVGGVIYSLKDTASLIASHYHAKVVFTPFPDKDLKIESGSTYFDSSGIEKILVNVEYTDLNSLLN